jgi:hypothetical protein
MLFLLQGLLVVGGAVGLALVGLALTRRFLPRRMIEERHQLSSTTMQILGASYGVLVAFVFVVVWGDFQDAQEHTVNEAAELATLYRLSPALPEPARSEVRRAIDDYLRVVTEDEWRDMIDGRSDPRARDLIGGLWSTLLGVPPVGRDAAVYQASLTHLASLERARELRLLDAQTTLPRPIWVVLLIGGTLTVGCIYFLGTADASLEALMTAALAGMIALVLFMIASLDNPFHPPMGVTPDGYRIILDEVLRGG